MESIEQPFDNITRIGQDMGETHDKAGLIDTDGPGKNYHNGDSPRAESSPLHHQKSTNSILHGPQNKGLRIIIVSAVVFAIAVTVALILTIYLEPKQVHGHAAVACDDVRCSDIGLQVLRDGGNAVDATVAAAFCLGVVNPAHSGIGGGGFAVVHDHKFQRSWGYDFRETAPEALSIDSLKQPGLDGRVASVGVPGTVKGLKEIHSTHGKLSWRDLLQPARDLAENGFVVSEELARTLRNRDINDFTGTPLEVFLQQGSFKDVNDTIALPDLAQTLRAIQNDANSLYEGALRDQFLEDLQMVSSKALITAMDIKDYKVKNPEVLSTKFKGLNVIGLPPPAGGTMVALMLNMIDNLDWKSNQGNDSVTYHQLIEVFKFAFAQRPLLGDPEFTDNMTNVYKELTSDEFAQSLAKEITNVTYPKQNHYGPKLQPSFSGGTTHLSVIDASELMVSATLSINNAFGSKLMLGNTGIILNDELLDFTMDASSPNSPKNGKRPLSSMSPTLVYNKEHPCAHRIIVGATNGIKIPTGVVESIVNSVIFNLNISSAIAAPRVHSQWNPPETLAESGIPQAVLDDLKAKGHNVSAWPVSEASSMVMGIEKTNDEIRAYSDYRKFGEAALFK